MTLDRAVDQETGASGRRYRNITLTMDVVEFGADEYAHRKQVDVKQLYNQVPRRAWVSWSSRQNSSQFEAERTSSRQIAWDLRTPVEQPSRMRKKCCYSQRNLGSICGSLSPSPTHLSHITNVNPFATLSRIKCERYIFLKKCVRSSLLLIIFSHVYVYV